MKYILTDNQFINLINESEKAFTPLIAKLFKFLNEEKKKNKTRASLLEKIKNLALYMDLPKGHELYLLELYLLNYREDGDYLNLTKDNFVDPRKMKGKTTPNTNAQLYTIAQLPFKGSNLRGYWDRDPKGNSFYTVESYGWYPIYIYKYGNWYEVTKRYSSSTSKQMFNANPVDWDDFLQTKVYLLTPQEMKDLTLGKTHSEIMKSKLEKLKGIEPSLKNRKMRSTKTYSWGNEQNNIPNTNIKFKVNSIEVEGDKAIVTIDVHDVVKREQGVGVKTPENYLKGELPNLTKEKVEEKIKNYMRNDLKEYVGTRFRWTGEEPLDTKIIFKFNHLKK